MGRVFCTFEEAAGWLSITEPELETMLRDGVLHEYRDGADRLLRLTDVRALVATRFSDGPEQQEPAWQMQPTTDYGQTQEAHLLDIRLPLAGTAVLEAPTPRATETAARPARTRPEKTLADIPAEAPREDHPPRRTLRSQPGPGPRPWPGPRPEKPSLRKDLWTGVIEDRPFAIFALSALIVVGISALVAGAYLLIEIL